MTTTQPTGKIIPIRSVEDLIQLDERQLDACLKDLKTWVQFRQGLNAKIQLGGEHLKALGIGDDEIAAMKDGVIMQDHMAWVDDGIDGGEVNLEIMDENMNVLDTAQLHVDGKGQVTS